MKKAKCIMIQGTMSDAGKSILCAGLCRIFKQDGYKVAPFKSQNMALNSYVTKDGLEMGRAQAVQAFAAGIEPDSRMNPILLKPSSDTGSQIIVNGEVRASMSAVDYYKYKPSLIPDVLEAYNSLVSEYDIIVIEGAGSPAEINLRDNDIVNMGLAEMVDAPVLLAGDIDRGGVFAQLYGTYALLSSSEQSRIKGMIINKFRGDPSILEPGLKMLEQKMNIPFLGVVPYLNIDIDDEDSMSTRLISKHKTKSLDIAVIRLPRISNFTDFAPLENHPLIGIRYVKNTSDLGKPDLLILPGTKSTMSDLKWLREQGFEAQILKLASLGIPILGICGGYQMLGETLSDPNLIEGSLSYMRGLGLLPCHTEFTGEKILRQTSAVSLPNEFSDANMTGYEIHMGITKAQGEPFCALEDGKFDGCCYKNVFGTYLHGLFDSGELADKIADWLCKRKNLDISLQPTINHIEYQEQQFDKLAEALRESLDIKAIYNVLKGDCVHE